MAYKVQAVSALPSKDKAGPSSPAATVGDTNSPKVATKAGRSEWRKTPRHLVSVPVTRDSALGKLVSNHLKIRRHGVLSFLAAASLRDTGDDYRASCPPDTGEEILKSIQSILSEHPLETERIFNGEVRSNGHTKPNPYDVVSFIFHASGFTASQSTFLKKELLLKHMGQLPVSITGRGPMPFSLFTEKPSDAAVCFTVSTRLSSEAVYASLSATLGMKPYFVVAIDNKKQNRLGEIAADGDDRPVSLGLAGKRLSPKTTHIALVSALDSKAYNLLQVHKDGFRLELEGEDPVSAPVVHVSRVYSVIPRLKLVTGEGATKRTRAESFATGAWGKTIPPSSLPPTSLGAGRVTDREVILTAAPVQNVVNPSFPDADPQVLDTQLGTGPKASSLVEEVLTVVGARKATGGPEGDVSKNDQKCATTRSPEEVTLSGQKRDRGGNPQPHQDPTIELKVYCQGLKTSLKALTTALPRDEDEIGRTARQLHSGLGDLIVALDTQILYLKAERKTILGIKNIGDSRAIKEVRQTKAQQLLERKEGYEKLRVQVMEELTSLQKVEAEAEAVAVAEANSAGCMDDGHEDYGADGHLDKLEEEEQVQEMMNMISSEGIEPDAPVAILNGDVANITEVMGRSPNPDGTTMSMRLAQKAKATAVDATRMDKVEKPSIKVKTRGKSNKISNTLQAIVEEEIKEQEEAAMDVGAVTAINNE
jgi:hypothetical protein